MNQKKLVPALLVSLSLVVAAPLFAADKKDPKESAPAKKADTYPLKTCVVSDEALGSMGDYVSYVHKEAGKPDREIRFCCDGCIDDFKKEPAKFLKKLDDAAAGKKVAPAAPAAKEHKH